MKAAELRQSILQMAVQGKLVPQDLHDEPVSELLARIKAEKAQLIKEGKIKRGKALPPIADDEIPYDLPDGWVWCRLGKVALLITSGSRDWARYYADEGAIFLRMGNLSRNNYHLRLKSIQHVKPPKNSEGNRTRLEPMDILVSITGEVGNLGLVPDGLGEAYINQHTALVRFPVELQNLYFANVFLSPLCKKQFEEPQRGIKNSFRLTDLSYMLLPLPPLAEQQRIVKKVDELMAMCDELETAEKELDTLENHFIEYLPKSILQMAVQGKLVPQDLHDEPASELQARITAEKAKLIKDGKLKKEKPLPPITEDEIPYDLPEGWVWCRLGEVHSIHRGITFPASAKFKEPIEGTVCCATTGSVQTVYNSEADVFIPEKYVKNSNQWLQENDIIMSTANSRELVGKTCIWKGAERKTFGGFLTVIRTKNDLFQLYSYYAIQYLWKSGAFITSATQTTNIANINNVILNEALFPLPPVAEQQRIVAKVDELMSLCDKLKSARNMIVPTTDDTIIPFPSAPDEEPLHMVAQGTPSQSQSAELRQAIDDLFGDDSDE